MAGSLYNLGLTFEAIGKHEEAMKYYAKSNIMQKTLYKGETIKIQEAEINKDIFDFQKSILFNNYNLENSKTNLIGDTLDDD